MASPWAGPDESVKSLACCAALRARTLRGRLAGERKGEGEGVHVADHAGDVARHGALVRVRLVDHVLVEPAAGDDAAWGQAGSEGGREGRT